MAFSSSTVWEVRTTGSDSNGGGYSSGGVDYSQQDTAQVALTDMVINGTTNTIFSSATLGSDSNYIGNIINVTGGTGFTVQRVQIVSRSGANYTVDKSLGTLGSTGGTGNLGGALASLGVIGAVAAGGNTVYQKYSASVYSISNTSTNTSGGPVSWTNGALGSPVYVVGYDTTRTLLNTDSNRPTNQVASSGVSSITFMTTGSYGEFNARNIIIDGNSKTSINGFAGNQGGNATRCKAINCTGTAFNIAAWYCHAVSCGSGFSAGWACIADGCTTGFGGPAVGSIAINGVNGFYTAGGGTGYYISCVAYNNSQRGFFLEYARGGFFAYNCIAYGNGTYGFQAGTQSGEGTIINCAAGSNTSGATSGFTSTTVYAPGLVALTANPFTNAAGGDFSLNNTAGGGAACRAAGFPGVFPNGTTTSYLDIGAVQHQDSGGSGGMGVLIGTGGGLIR